MAVQAPQQCCKAVGAPQADPGTAMEAIQEGVGADHEGEQQLQSTGHADLSINACAAIDSASLSTVELVGTVMRGHTDIVPALGFAMPLLTSLLVWLCS